MTEFEKWFESDEYVHDVNGVHFNVTAHVNLDNECDNRIELTNCKEFAEVCFNKGFDKGKNSKGCSLVNCSGRENGIKYRQAKTLLKQCDKFLTSDFNDENLEKDLKTNLIRDIHKLLNLSEE